MREDNTSARRRALLLDVTQAAAEVGRLVREARASTCPWRPASATAAPPWSAGPSCSGRSCRYSPNQSADIVTTRQRGRPGSAEPSAQALGCYQFIAEMGGSHCE
jgi:hypothetical protein